MIRSFKFRRLGEKTQPTGIKYHITLKKVLQICFSSAITIAKRLKPDRKNCCAMMTVAREREEISNFQARIEATDDFQW
jgi:hypothetical protein